MGVMVLGLSATLWAPAGTAMAKQRTTAVNR